MALSIAQMRESGSVGLPERTIRMCLAQKLVAEVRSLEREKIELGPVSSEDGQVAPGRIGNPNAARVSEIDARLAEVLDEMDEHTGTLTIRAQSAGEWRRWADANPARVSATNEDGSRVVDPIDLDVAYGYVNASTLLDGLSAFAVAWNGEPLGPGDFEWLVSKAAPGDLSEVCRQVVQMHENVGQIPKSRRPSPATPNAATG